MNTNKETLRSYQPFIDLDFKLAGIRHIIERAQGSPKEIVQAAEYITRELDSCLSEISYDKLIKEKNETEIGSEGLPEG